MVEIKGLTFIENFLSIEEEENLLNQIDQEIWLNDLKRRVQHYGYKYDYKSRKIDETMKIGDLPMWGKKIAERLFQLGYFDVLPDQLIVNEYEVGQGISAHIDCVPCFNDTIVSISLASTSCMNFIHQTTAEKIPVFLPKRSMVVLQKEARYDWKHSIPSRKTDKHNGITYPRARRVSLTFRKVII